MYGCLLKNTTKIFVQVEKKNEKSTVNAIQFNVRKLLSFIFSYKEKQQLQYNYLTYYKKEDVEYC